MRPRILSTMLLALALAASVPGRAMILVQIPGMSDACAVESSREGTLTKELRVAAERKGGGRLEIAVRCKERMTAELARLHEQGTPALAIEVAMHEQGKPICYLKYKLERCFVKSWSTSGDADDRPTEAPGNLVLEYGGIQEQSCGGG